mmetsp:Transcript_45471/g.95456  ORF Transcript_45471/g.95456 Transcript_45471/m.95456 type:complete len:350 (-) Transcript_45471:322-1371(-)
MGHNHSYVFTQQENGYFEQTLVMDQSYDWIQLSGRTLLVRSSDDGNNEVITALNLEMCTQEMPTQMPSTSAAPSNLHSVIPSPAPSFSSGPSISLRPSQVPSLSLAPTRCYDVSIRIITGADTLADGGTLTWEFYKEQSLDGGTPLHRSGGPLESDRTYENLIPCLAPSDYVFNITKSTGNGFGECDSCEYFISVDGELMGRNSFLLYNEVLRFPVPFAEQDGDGNDQMSQPCLNDFYFSIYTDESIPERTTWILENNIGELVLSGGPYYEPEKTFTEWSCLSDGRYNFTIFDSVVDGEAVGNYALSADYDTLVFSDLNFGTSNSTVFVTGTFILDPTPQPTISNANGA